MPEIEYQVYIPRNGVLNINIDRDREERIKEFELEFKKLAETHGTVKEYTKALEDKVRLHKELSDKITILDMKAQILYHNGKISNGQDIWLPVVGEESKFYSKLADMAYKIGDNIKAHEYCERAYIKKDKVLEEDIEKIDFKEAFINALKNGKSYLKKAAKVRSEEKRKELQKLADISYNTAFYMANGSYNGKNLILQDANTYYLMHSAYKYALNSNKKTMADIFAARFIETAWELGNQNENIDDIYNTNPLYVGLETAQLYLNYKIGRKYPYRNVVKQFKRKINEYEKKNREKIAKRFKQQQEKYDKDSTRYKGRRNLWV